MRVVAVSLFLVSMIAVADAGERRWHPVGGAIEDFDPTAPGLHDYAPPTPVGRGDGNAYLGAGYIEYLYSGGRTPRLPPKTVYVGPMHQEPYGNRRTQLQRGASSRSGVYVATPEHAPRLPFIPAEPIAGPHGYAAPVVREEVAFASTHAPGTIVINTRERFLYLVQPGGRAVRYAVGVGRDGFGWKGIKTVSAKREWPDWRPPADMLARRPDLPRHMPGGPENPLGARALYLGNTLYRIHGSNEPETIGAAVSSGCFRLTNEDVIDLYARVPVGAKVVVL